MGIALIWIGLLAAALSTVALSVALAARWPRPAGTALLLLVGLAGGTGFALLAFFSRFNRYALGREQWVFTGGNLAALLFAGGALALVLLGRRPAAPGLPARAAGWRPARLLLLLAASLAVLVTSARNARLSLQQSLAIRRSELASLEQLFWPGIPPSLNAAPLYALAYEKLVPLDRVPGAREAFEAAWQKPTPGAAQAAAPGLAAWVQANQATLAYAVEGTQRPGYASVEDALWRSSPFGSGREGKIARLEMNRAGHDPSTVDNELSRRRVGDLLQARSLLRAFTGQLPLAIGDANALLALAEQTSSPWLRPERLVERLLAAPGLTDAALAGLRFPRGDALDTRLQRLLIRSEHAWLTLSERIGSSPRDPLDQAFKRSVDLLWAEDDLLETERSYDKLWEAIYAPAAQRAARLEGAVRPPRPGPLEFGAWHLLTGLTQLFRDEAERDCAVVGVAVARYRLAHGAWPERLDALVPGLLAEIPRDPFGGAALRYRAGATDARVYSVGPDLQDDGGTPSVEGKGDLVFTVALPR